MPNSPFIFGPTGMAALVPTLQNSVPVADASGNITWTSASGSTYTAPTIQKFTSGSGTYTTPAGVTYIRVKMVGGGGGGSGGGSSAGSGGDGGTTTFGTSLLSASGGIKGIWNATAAAVGGTASLGTGPIGVALPGGTGNGGSNGGANAAGGSGGNTPFGGAGTSGSAIGAGVAAATNTGSGGGGGGSGSTNNSGSGGGAGAYVDAIISAPLATYSYAVGAAGTAGTAGTSGAAGGAGGSGLIIVEEYYYPTGVGGITPVSAVKTANYTLLNSDSVVIGDATSGAFTFTLPTAVGITGKQLTLTRKDQTLANQISIATTSSQTIGFYGTSVTLATQNETWVLISDGANWQVMSHLVPSNWTSYSAAIGAVTTNPTEASSAVRTQFWRRVGDSCEITFIYTQTATTGATLGSGTYLFQIPGNLTIDTGKATVSTSGNGGGGTYVGSGQAATVQTANTSSQVPTIVIPYNTIQLAMYVFLGGTPGMQGIGSVAGAYGLTSAAGVNYHFRATVPITGWKG